jgi:hypothetical protein
VSGADHHCVVVGCRHTAIVAQGSESRLGRTAPRVTCPRDRH